MSGEDTSDRTDFGFRQVPEGEKAPEKVAEKSINSVVLAEQNKQKKVGELLASFNKSYRDAKYKEAYQFASLAHEMDPDNAIATAYGSQ